MVLMVTHNSASTGVFLTKDDHVGLSVLHPYLAVICCMF